MRRAFGETTIEELPPSKLFQWLGVCAADHLYDLNDAPPTLHPGSRWSRSDTRSLNTWYYVEEAVQDGLAGVPDRPLRELLSESVARYHAALPFTESERLWLHSIYRQHREAGGGGTYVGTIRRRHGHAMAAGSQSSIEGRKLLRSWMAWRRGTDEFAESLDVARAAMTQIVQLTPETTSAHAPGGP